MTKIIDGEDKSELHYGNAKKIAEELLDSVLKKEITLGEAYRQLLGGMHFFYKKLLHDAIWEYAQWDDTRETDDRIESDEANGIVVKDGKTKLRTMQAYMNTQAMITSATIDFSNSMEEIEGENPINVDIKNIEVRTLFIFYPQFKKDYELLKQNEYFIETENGLKWLKTKQSLAEYFGYQAKTNRWEIIQAIFNETDLKNAFYKSGIVTKKMSRGYKDWLDIIKKYPSK